MNPASEYPSYCGSCRKIGYLNNHNSYRRHELRYIKSSGYVDILVNGKYEAEHRYVMEHLLGRKLINRESVHHIDGDKQNNIPSNLELWVKSHLSGIRASELICPHCGKSYIYKSGNILG